MATATLRTVFDIPRIREIIANPRSGERILALLRRRTSGGPSGVDTYRHASEPKQHITKLFCVIPLLALDREGF